MRFDSNCNMTQDSHRVTTGLTRVTAATGFFKDITDQVSAEVIKIGKVSIVSCLSFSEARD